ncbi:MAG: DUF4434 domain-containing protein [Thermodesulfobacteria bacterium]|nr:DUF4434 domain-containing protein [Thermodesulfobacteriota bacterium]
MKNQLSFAHLLTLLFSALTFLIVPGRVSLACPGSCIGWDCIDNPNLATAAFVQLNLDSANRGPQWWYNQLAAMNDIGIDTIIVQYTGLDDGNDNLAFYDSSIPGVTPLTSSDPIEYILQAADDLDLEVYLGIHLITYFDIGGTYSAQDIIQRGKDTIDELDSIYGYYGRNHESLSGWYFPQEINDLIALTPAYSQLGQDLIAYTGQLSDYAHATTGLVTMISPYFGQSPDAQAYAQWWDDVALPNMSIDIISMQDGVGTRRTTLLEARQVFAALQPVLERQEVELWSTNEAFDQIHGFPVDDAPYFQAVPATFSEFQSRLNSTAMFVKKAAVFEFTNYLSPYNGSGQSLDLYQQYMDYVDEEVQRLDVVDYHYELASTVSFHPAARDDDLDKLSDFVTGVMSQGPGSSFSNGTFVGIVGQGTGPKPAIVLDLGKRRHIDSVSIYYLVDASSGIYAPQEIVDVANALTISTSLDGTSFLERVSTNEFVPWQRDQADGSFELRKVRLDLEGVRGRFLKIDIRTFNDMIFLGEIAVYGRN